MSEHLWNLICQSCHRRVVFVFRYKPTTRIPCARCGSHDMKAVRGEDLGA